MLAAPLIGSHQSGFLSTWDRRTTGVLRKMYKVLKPGGLLLVHAIGSVISSPTLRLPEGEWLNREIFPGGVLPSFGQIASASDGLFTLLDAQEFGPYYDLTLMAWNENFERGWPEIQHLYDARFYRLWRYYLHFWRPRSGRETTTSYGR